MFCRASRQTVNLMDKVHQRLATWNINLLYIDGRATLVQVVTVDVSIYAMHTIKFPTSVCNSLDRLNRSFFVGDTKKKKNVYMCQLNLVCRPKCSGGLGFK